MNDSKKNQTILLKRYYFSMATEYSNRMTKIKANGYTGHIVPPVPDMLCHLKQM